VHDAVCKPPAARRKPEASARAESLNKQPHNKSKSGMSTQFLLSLIAVLQEVISMLLFLTGLFAGSILMFGIISMLMVAKESDR
jgi:hypothetical protein